MKVVKINDSIIVVVVVIIVVVVDEKASLIVFVHDGADGQSNLFFVLIFICFLDLVFVSVYIKRLKTNNCFFLWFVNIFY